MVVQANGKLPAEVVRVIDKYYANPIKIGLDGRPQDSRLFALSHQESVILAGLVYSYAPADSVDVGLGAASSAIAIAAARMSLGLRSKHISLDPYQESRSGSVGLVEISNASMDAFVDWLPERSESFFSASIAENKKYDFVFVDGAHDIGQKLTDSFYIQQVLNPGGLVVFHDGLLFSTSVAIKYLVTQCNFRLLFLPADSKLKRAARMVRYLPSLGPWYASRVIPKMHRSLVALTKVS